MSDPDLTVVWSDPPPPIVPRARREGGGRTSKLAATADLLRTRPGEWARIVHYDDHGDTGLSTAINQGLRGFTPAGEWEGRSRRLPGGGLDVWACYRPTPDPTPATAPRPPRPRPATPIVVGTALPGYETDPAETFLALPAYQDRQRMHPDPHRQQQAALVDAVLDVVAAVPAPRPEPDPPPVTRLPVPSAPIRHVLATRGGAGGGGIAATGPRPAVLPAPAPGPSRGVHQPTVDLTVLCTTCPHPGRLHDVDGIGGGCRRTGCYCVRYEPRS